MGFRNLFQGSHLVIVLIIVLLVFGASRLPQIAKSLGQSMKILKSEVRDLREDDSGAEEAKPDDAAPKA